MWVPGSKHRGGTMRTWIEADVTATWQSFQFT